MEKKHMLINKHALQPKRLIIVPAPAFTKTCTAACKVKHSI
jgi:hypothetical protein